LSRNDFNSLSAEARAIIDFVEPQLPAEVQESCCRYFRVNDLPHEVTGSMAAELERYFSSHPIWKIFFHTAVPYAGEIIVICC